jgi:hypothetical protein
MARKPQIENSKMVINLPYPQDKIDEERRLAEEQRVINTLEARRISRKLNEVEEKQLVDAQKKVDAEEKERQRILSINRKADARLQIQRLNEQEKQRKQAEKELTKKQKAQAKIDKAGGIVYVKAKRKHLKYKRKQQIKKWHDEETTPKAFRRKKGKIGTSPVGNVIHSVLYPLKPKKKGRW